MKKYELTDEIKVVDGHTLHRIKAIKEFTIRSRGFDFVKKGDKGGWIESEENLSQKDSCWIFDEGKVYGRARVIEDALVFGSAKIYGNAIVYENALVCENAKVFEASCVFGRAIVSGNATVRGNSDIDGDTIIH